MANEIRELIKQRKKNEMLEVLFNVSSEELSKKDSEIAELRAKITKKDEVISGLIEVLGVSVDETAELRDFLDKVATCEIETFSFEVGDSGDTDCIEYVCTDIVEEANELLAKYK